MPGESNMKNKATTDTRQIVAIGLLAASLVMAALVLVKVAGFYLGSAEAQDLAEKAAAQKRGDKRDVEEHVAKSRNIADELKQKNLFAPPIKKVHPIKEVQGIIGSDVLIAGKLYKVGDSIKGAKIVDVGSTAVTIEWEGQRKEFAPIAAASGYASAPVKAPVVEKTPAVKSEAPATVPKQAPSTTVAEDPFKWLGVEVPPDVKEEFMKRWDGLSDEKKAQAREEWDKLTDEQKKQAVEKWKRGMER